jgi:hypothetical protein
MTNEHGMFRPWKCRVCKKLMAAYLLERQNAHQRTGVCGECLKLPPRPEDKRITALKEGKKVSL